MTGGTRFMGAGITEPRIGAVEEVFRVAFKHQRPVGRELFSVGIREPSGIGFAEIRRHDGECP